MNSLRLPMFVVGACVFFLSCTASGNDAEDQSAGGVAIITPTELKLHLDFLAADELPGRDTPSNELNIAAKYLALVSESYGLKPLMPDGSFFQNLPLEAYRISARETKTTLNGSRDFSFPSDFGFKPGEVDRGTVSGEIVFLGYGLQAPEASWDDLNGVDVQGKIALIMDVDLPDDSRLRQDVDRRTLRDRGRLLMTNGAAAVVSIISEGQEASFRESGRTFDNSIRARYLEAEGVPASPHDDTPRVNNLVIRHEMAGRLLGVTRGDLTAMFDRVRRGEQVRGAPIRGSSLIISVDIEEDDTQTSNVVALLEGSDPTLKDEYVVFGAHYDHLGVRNGEVYNGASDNASGSAALLVIAKAMATQQPRRSVIFAWFSGEEKGLWGSQEFVTNPPVPLENISACINLDVMIGTDLSKVTTIGGRKLSSELDPIVQSVNNEFLDVSLDRKWDEPSSGLFFSSDHFNFMRNGIPSVWLSSEAEPSNDIHRPTDTPDKSNGTKIALISRMAFYAAMEIANRDDMLVLDLNPEITTRGSHNLDYDWSDGRE